MTICSRCGFADKGTGDSAHTCIGPGFKKFEIAIYPAKPTDDDELTPEEQTEANRILESELQEECRLNGMGSEREAKLLAKVESLEAENKKLREALEFIAKTGMSDHYAKRMAAGVLGK